MGVRGDLLKKVKYAKKKNSSVKVSEHKHSGVCCGHSVWMIASVALGVLFVASLILGLTGVLSSKESGLSQSRAEAKANEYVNLLSNPEMPLNIVGVEKDSGLFRIDLTVQGQRLAWYMSPDGSLFIPDVFSLDDIRMIVGQQQLQEQQAQPQLASYSNEEVESLVSCLADKDFVIYGADWCGYTNQVSSLFGGADISSIYVECTVEDALCNENEITGYPTIKIGGQVVNVQRSLAGFAEATGCAI